MDQPDEPRQILIVALEEALKTYKEQSAIDGRAKAAHAALSYLMAIKVETRLLAPLVEMAGETKEEQSRPGKTRAAYESNRLIAGAAAITMVFNHSRRGRQLSEIAKTVGKAVKIDDKTLRNYRKELTARGDQEEKEIYRSYIDLHFKRLLEAEGDFEKMVLSYLTGLLPKGATDRQKV